MPKVPLQGMTLNMLSDGFAGRVIDQGLAALVKDIEERGHDGKDRELNVKLVFTPEGEGRVEIDVQVQTKLPALRPPKTSTKFDKRSGGLVFNPDCADNPDQTTFADRAAE